MEALATESLVDKHLPTIERAIKALDERSFYAAWPEHPKAYGEDAPARGLEAFKGLMGERFDGLLQGESTSWIGEEVSPFTQQPLGVQYPSYRVEGLIANATAAAPKWASASPAKRAAILVESLERIKERFFEIAHATMHTTGQSFIMSFQASGPHANDRALEAVALGYHELNRYPSKVRWDKPMGKFNIVLEKTYKPVPKGVGLVIGCSTFPIWNSVPGLYADLVTGNTAIVKPHPKVVLPLAIVVAEIQHTLRDNGFDPLIVQLAVDSSGNLITKQLAEHDDVKLIDYTGSTAFGNYVESLPGKTVFTEKAGVNSVILDSVDDLDAVLNNLAFSVSLYSGQMCTAPQNFFIPGTGVRHGDAVIPYDEVVSRLKAAIEGLVQNPKMGPGTLAAIQNPATLDRSMSAANLGGQMILEPKAVVNEEFPSARTCSPALIEVTKDDTTIYEQELFGPIALIIKTSDTQDSIRLAQKMAREHGAITCAAYTTDPEVEEQISSAMESVFTPVSFNLTGFIWVNQHAGFSDFHVTGGNPAGNASFTDPQFINRRFVWVGHRKAMKG